MESEETLLFARSHPKEGIFRWVYHPGSPRTAALERFCVERQLPVTIIQAIYEGATLPPEDAQRLLAVIHAQCQSPLTLADLGIELQEPTDQQELFTRLERLNGWRKHLATSASSYVLSESVMKLQQELRWFEKHRITLVFSLLTCSYRLLYVPAARIDPDQAPMPALV